MIFYGEIKDGKLQMDQPQLANDWIATQQNMRVKVEIDKLHPEKTHNQLGYYFAVIVKHGSDFYGYSKEEMDREFCKKYLVYYDWQGRKYVKSKEDLNTKKMGEFIDACIHHLAMEGIQIPPSSKGTSHD